MTDLSLPVSSRPSRASALVALGRTFETWRRRSRERRELLALDARALRDLGTTPQAIEFEASKPFWRA